MIVILVFLKSQNFEFLPLSSLTSSGPPLTQKFVWPLLEPDQGTDPDEKEPGGEKKIRICVCLLISSLEEFTAWSGELQGRKSSGIDVRAGEREAGGEGCLNGTDTESKKPGKASP